MASALSRIAPTVNAHPRSGKWNISPLIARAFAFVTTFAVIYNITFRFNESVTSGRLAMLGLLLWFVGSGHRVRLDIDWRIFVVFIPFPYVLFQWALIGDPGQFSRFFHLALYSYAGGLIMAHMISNLKSMLFLLLTVIASQGAIILLSFVNIEYRSWLDAIIVTGGNYDAFDLYRAPGFTSNGGSSLSVVQSLGVLCGSWLLMLRRGSSAYFEMLVILGLMLLCLVSCAFVGRTGLYLSVLFLVITIIYSGSVRTSMALLVAAALLVYYVDLRDFAGFIPSEVSIEWLRNWMLGIFSDDDRTLSELASMPIPPLDQVDSWIGHGLVSIIDGGNPSGHDSGFIQAYFSMGLIFAICLYTSYLYVLAHLLSWLPNTLRCLLVVVFFALELKEPFLFKYVLVFILVATHALAGRASLARRRN